MTPMIFLRSCVQFLRKVPLWIGLGFAYFFLVTPVGLFLRGLGRRPLRGWEMLPLPSYWVPIALDSNAKELYEELGTDPRTTRGFLKWVSLLHAYRSLSIREEKPWKWLLLVAILPWAWLGFAPKKAEVSSDLYVLF